MAVKGEQKFHYVEVVSAERLTPSMVRVVFGGEGLAKYVSNGVPDECVTLYFPKQGEERPPAMTLQDGMWWYHDEADEREGRNYTVRRWDAEQHRMTVDFVAHEGGVAAEWALRAQPGQVLGLWGPRGWYNPPPGTAWQLLVADLTGLPALARAVEQLPAGVRAHVIVEVLEAGDVQRFDTRAEVSTQWLLGGNGHGPSTLPAAVRAFDLPAGRGYVWFAGEAADTRDVRKYLRRERGLAVTQFEIVGYWRVRSEEWMAKYQKVEKAVVGEYQRLLEEGVDERVADERWDEMLEEAGL